VHGEDQHEEDPHEVGLLPQVVMRLNVPRFMFKRQREVIQCGRDVTQILIYDTEIAVSLGDIVAVGNSFEV